MVTINSAFSQRTLADSLGRQFQYLRLSVTEACNFKCIYCLPGGYKKNATAEPQLSREEIRLLVDGFAQLGFCKVRLTGGEPTLRRDLVEIVDGIANTGGIKKIALTTNGYRLAELAKPLKDAGLTHLNISLDSLDREHFELITGSPRFDDVRMGIEKALECGFDAVKLNVVLLKSINDVELENFCDFVKNRAVSVRFIELMQTAQNSGFFSEHHLSGQMIREYLDSLGWSTTIRSPVDGPAQEFTHPDFLGRIGFIAPYSKHFCDSCNRLRVLSTGRLRLCLFGDGDFSLRPWLQSPDQCHELITMIQSLVYKKPHSHALHEGNYGNTSDLAAIGG